MYSEKLAFGLIMIIVSWLYFSFIRDIVRGCSFFINKIFPNLRSPRKLKNCPRNLFASKKNDKASGVAGKNFGDLNDDCLESVFMYLDESDLVSVVGASQRFKIPAQVVYKRKMATMHTFGSHLTHCEAQKCRIRNFGHFFKSIVLEIDLIEFDYQLLDTIVEYCGQHVTKIRIQFIGEPRRLRNSTKEQYCKFLKGLSVNFPKLNCLEYQDHSVNCFQSLECIANEFPCLTKLAVDVNEQSVETFKEIICMHSQLQSLSVKFIDVNESDELIDLVNEKLPNLTYIKIARGFTFRFTIIDYMFSIFRIVLFILRCIQVFSLFCTMNLVCIFTIYLCLMVILQPGRQYSTFGDSQIGNHQ